MAQIMPCTGAIRSRRRRRFAERDYGGSMGHQTGLKEGGAGLWLVGSTLLQTEWDVVW